MGSHLRTVARGRRALSVAVVVAMLVVSFAPAAVAMPRGDRTTSAPTVSAETVASTTTSEFTSLYQVAQQIGLVGSAAETQVPTGDGVQIALIDTGVVDVPGLRTSNVMIGPDFSFEDQAKALRGRDGNGHGTHLAGIMVGTDAAWKVGDTTRTPDRNLGIAPDAELVSIKVAAANGAVDVTQVIAAINWVIEHKDDQGMNIRVLALAYGTDSSQPYLVSPLAYAVERAWHAGIVVVVAAGNEGRSDWMLKNPATDPYVIAVGSVEQTADGYESSSFSSDGNPARTVDVVAPGRSIASLRVPGSYSDAFNEAGRVGDDLVRGSGTSQATAVVAGAAALLLEDNPKLTPDQVKRILIGSSVPFSDHPSGIGLIDVAGALDARVPRRTEQIWWRATGTGSIDWDRGTNRVALDGVSIDGEIDIFGNSWSQSQWSVDAWTGNSWSGNSWSGDSWSANVWSGNSWSGLSWSGLSWSGLSWSGLSWSGLSWSGNSWSDHTWD